ncbi:MAG: hypothetical protein R2771_05240 [Saprospiraceae bacterium]
MGTLPELDNLGRVKEFYGKRVHDSYRRPYFDAGLFAETYDSEEAKKVIAYTKQDVEFCNI